MISDEGIGTKYEQHEAAAVRRALQSERARLEARQAAEQSRRCVHVRV